MAYKPNILDVPSGGSGLPSLTSFAPIFGGISSTGNFQSGTLGASGTALTSNGPGNLPTFQPINSGSGYIYYLQLNPGNPVASTTYFLGNITSTLISSTASSAATYFVNPLAATATLNSVYGNFQIAGTLASSENITLSFRKNNTTDTVITSTMQWNSSSVNFNATALGISLSAGDFFEVKLVTPAWVTAPTTVSLSMTMLMQ